MPIWGEKDQGLNWRRVLPPALAVVAVACVGYLVYSCSGRSNPNIVRTSEQMEFYLSQLDSNDPLTRASAVRVIAQPGDPRALAEIRKRLEDEDGRVVAAACAALASLDDRDSVDAILSLLGSQDLATVVGAIEALGVFREQRAVTPLLGLLRSPRAALRLPAIVALGKIGDASAVASLQVLKGDPCWGLKPESSKTERAGFRKAVTEALAALGVEDKEKRPDAPDAEAPPAPKGAPE